MSRSRLVALLMLTFSALLNFPDSVVYGYQFIKVLMRRQKSILAGEAQHQSNSL